MKIIFFQRKGKIKAKIKEYLIGSQSVPREQKYKTKDKLMKHQNCAGVKVSAVISTNKLRIYKLLSTAQGIFSRINHILSQEASLCKCINIKITSCILFKWRIKLKNQRPIENATHGEWPIHYCTMNGS